MAKNIRPITNPTTKVLTLMRQASEPVYRFVIDDQLLAGLQNGAKQDAKHQIAVALSNLARSGVLRRSGRGPTAIYELRQPKGSAKPTERKNIQLFPGTTTPPTRAPNPSTPTKTELRHLRDAIDRARVAHRETAARLQDLEFAFEALAQRAARAEGED